MILNILHNKPEYVWMMIAIAIDVESNGDQLLKFFEIHKQKSSIFVKNMQIMES